MCERPTLDVIDSRIAKLMNKPTVRRRRRCSSCNYRYTTFEVGAEIVSTHLTRIYNIATRISPMIDEIKTISYQRKDFNPETEDV